MGVVSGEKRTSEDRLLCTETVRYMCGEESEWAGGGGGGVGGGGSERGGGWERGGGGCEE